MPFPPSPALPEDMPDDLVIVSAESDEAISEGLSDMVPTPERPYSGKTVDALAKAVADVARVMGLDVTPPKYEGKVEALDPDMVRFIAMIDAAAEDYGSPLSVSLPDLTTDAALTRLTVEMQDLAKDAGFAEFLDEPVDEEEVEEIDESVEEPDGEDEDFDFAARMR